jgi:hypothetical protein
MITILVLIIFLVIFNVLLLKDETLNKVDETLDEQSDDNMVALVRESAAFLFSEF